MAHSVLEDKAKQQPLNRNSLPPKIRAEVEIEVKKKQEGRYRRLYVGA